MSQDWPPSFRNYILVENSENTESPGFQGVTETQPPAETTAENTAGDPANALLQIAVFVAAVYLFKIWLGDLKAAKNGKPNDKAFAGAVPTSMLAIGIAVTGIMVLLALQVAGEYGLGIVAEQKDLTWIFLLLSIAAGFFEELIFRGYLVVTKKGRTLFYTSIAGFSLLFALLHPHLWSFELPDEAAAYAIWEGTLEFHFTTKAFFTTSFLFINSLWFYACRFLPQNTGHSLLPCIAAHASYNVAVFIIKLAQGHISGLY